MIALWIVVGVVTFLLVATAITASLFMRHMWTHTHEDLGQLTRGINELFERVGRDMAGAQEDIRALSAKIDTRE